MAEHVYLTRVHQNFEGDTFFPAIDSELWQMVSEHKFIADDKHAFAYSFQTWDKRP
jgi:dihydrofolate reductase